MDLACGWREGPAGVEEGQVEVFKELAYRLAPVEAREDQRSRAVTEETIREIEERAHLL